MADPGDRRKIAAVKRCTAAILQEGALQTNPLSTEMSARTRFDELTHERSASPHEAQRSGRLAASADNSVLQCANVTNQHSVIPICIKAYILSS